MRRLPLLFTVLAALIALTACGSGEPPESGASAAGDRPVATGRFGDKPDLTIPAGTPPTKLAAEVLSEGDGETVRKGDLLVVDYLGQTWKPTDGKENVFDNSYDRGEKTAFGIGVGAVIPGWDKTLVGQKVGSRVLLTIPPGEGYGDQASGGIPANSTLVFVVDIADRFGVDSSADGTPVDPPAGLPTVTGGENGTPPTVDLAGTKPPKSPRAAVVVRGDGEPIAGAKNLALQVHEVSWPKGAKVSSTYDRAPTPLPTARLTQQLPPLAQALEGQRIGTRIVLALPAQQGRPGTVAVLDVIGAF